MSQTGLVGILEFFGGMLLLFGLFTRPVAFVLADPLDAERLAADGRRIWIGDPLDAFPRPDQRLYLDWIRGDAAGDALLQSPVRIVVVQRRTPAQKRLAGRSAFRELARDDRAVVYATRS